MKRKTFEQVAEVDQVYFEPMDLRGPYEPTILFLDVFMVIEFILGHEAINIVV